MNKIAIIIEDMRLGASKTINLFLKSYKKKNNKYLIIAPRNSKKKFLNS